MAKAPKVKLDVNVPLTGVVKYISHYDEKPNPDEPGKVYPAQWAMDGQWSWTTPAGEPMAATGKVYIDDYQLTASPIALGLAEESGKWDDGSTRYKWTGNGPVRVVKVEDGKKRHVTISRLTDAAYTAAAGSAPPLTGYAAATAQRPASASTPAPVPHTKQDTAAVVFGDPWNELERAYARAQGIAVKAWGQDYDPSALVAATATILIAADKRGIKTGSPADSFAGMPPALQQTEKMPWD